MISNLVLFSGRLFDTPGENCASNAPEAQRVEVMEIGTEAEASLRSACGKDCELLLPPAWNDLRSSLSQFLDHLLLLQPNEKFVQGIVRHWVQAQREMLSRLKSDRNALESGLVSACGLVARVEAALSDRHDGGRTVAVLTFESGSRIVYKPRDTGIEEWYHRFAEWMNALEVPFPVRAAAVIARPGYGWMEFVPYQPCEPGMQLALYYRNAGALLCVLHLLRARDCHFQNLIACGQHPVLVDAEMLFQPQLAVKESTSVTQTGMIPTFRFGPGGEHYDVSGLGFVEPKSTHFRVAQWSEAGIQYATGVLTPRQNIPFMPNQPERPQDYVSEMVDGFTRTYRFLADHRREVAEWIGTTAARLQVRYLVRETMEYYEALQLDLSPGSEGEVALPSMPSHQEVFSALRQQEIASLKRLEVPRFTLATEGRSLSGIDDCFYRSGLKMVVAGLDQLSEADLAKQLRQIHLSWSLSLVSASLQ